MNCDRINKSAVLKCNRQTHHFAREKIQTIVEKQTKHEKHVASKNNIAAQIVRVEIYYCTKSHRLNCFNFFFKEPNRFHLFFHF